MIESEDYEKRSRRAIFGMALVFIALALVAAVIITSHQTAYPHGVQVDVVAGCEQGGGTPSSCRCYLSELQKRFSLAEYTKMAEQTPPAQPFIQIAQKCADK